MIPALQHSITPMLHYFDTPFVFGHFCFISRPSRRTTMNRLESLRLWRVRYPFASRPQGEVSCCQPPPLLDLPAPPPLGWSTGLRDTPRLIGRMPRCRDRPALPNTTLSSSEFPTWPMVAYQFS